MNMLVHIHEAMMSNPELVGTIHSVFDCCLLIFLEYNHRSQPVPFFGWNIGLVGDSVYEPIIL